MSFAEDRKPCSHCNRERPLSKFGRNVTRFDGLQSWCKDCAREVARETRRRYKEANSVAAGSPPQGPAATPQEPGSDV